MTALLSLSALYCNMDWMAGGRCAGVGFCRAYGGRDEVETQRSAVTYLGFNTLYAIALYMLNSALHRDLLFYATT